MSAENTSSLPSPSSPSPTETAVPQPHRPPATVPIKIPIKMPIKMPIKIPIKIPIKMPIKIPIKVPIPNPPCNIPEINSKIESNHQEKSESSHVERATPERTPKAASCKKEENIQPDLKGEKTLKLKQISSPVNSSKNLASKGRNDVESSSTEDETSSSSYESTSNSETTSEGSASSSSVSSSEDSTEESSVSESEKSKKLDRARPKIRQQKQVVHPTIAKKLPRKMGRRDSREIQKPTTSVITTNVASSDEDEDCWSLFKIAKRKSMINTEIAAAAEDPNAVVKSIPPKRPPRIAFPSDIDNKIQTVSNQLATAKANIKIKEDGKSISTTTSKANYIDPRIIFSWCRRLNVPPQRAFTKSLVGKYQWAQETEENYRF